MAAKIDIKSGSSIKNDKNGYHVERVASVSGVTGSIEDLLQNAIEDAQLPNKGDAHPTITNITLNSLTAMPRGGGKYRVVMSYSTDQSQVSGSNNASVRASATTTTEEIKTDNAGNAMETSYVVNLTTYNETWKAEVQRPRVTFDFEYTASIFPQTEIDTYLGRINSVIWNGYAVETILCTAINVDQSGSDYRVRFSFSFNSDTWAFIAKTSRAASAIDSSTDVDLDQTTGTKSFDVYPAADFTALGFTF